MRTLVTGASGFVGQHLVRELLRAGHRVVGTTLDGAAPDGPTLTRAEAEATDWIALDLTSATSVAAGVRNAEPEWICHLAANSSVAHSFAAPLETWDVNSMGTVRLLTSLAQLPGTPRCLIVSSAEVYGVVPEARQPISEDTLPMPVNPYGASKAAAEMAALSAAAQGGVEVIIARSFNHTGPGQDPRFSLPSFARQLSAIRQGDAPPLLQVGNLSARRDVLDVRDVVRAYHVLLNRGASGGIYNVCSGTAHTIHSLVERMVAISGTTAGLEVDSQRVRPVDVPLLVGDPTRLHALGWNAEIPLDATLADLLQSADA